MQLAGQLRQAIAAGDAGQPVVWSGGRRDGGQSRDGCGPTERRDRPPRGLAKQISSGFPCRYSPRRPAWVVRERGTQSTCRRGPVAIPPSACGAANQILTGLTGHLIEEYMELSGSEVDDVIAEAEAERNRADACIAAAVSVISARQSFRDDGHASMRSYLKGTLNCSGASPGG